VKSGLCVRAAGEEIVSVDNLASSVAFCLLL
jgi:hypothetical protein